MAANQFDVAVQLKLLDELTGGVARPLAAMQRLQRAIGQTTSEANRSVGVMARLATAYENLSMRAERAAARMSALRGRALGVVAGAFGLALPLANAASYEMQLTRLAQIFGWSGSGGELRVGGKVIRFESVADGMRQVNASLAEVSAATGQSTMDLLNAATTIASVYGDVFETGGLTDISKMATTMQSVAQWMTAAGVSSEDAANAAVAMMRNVGLSADALSRAFNAMTVAGKLGGFEAKDMARWFPTFLATYGGLYGTRVTQMTRGMSESDAQRFRDALALGMVANISAYAQLARVGAGDASMAGTNLMNIFQKLMIEETSKHYEKVMGINFRDLIYGTALRGDDVIMEVIKSVNALVDKHGGNITYVGELFGDMQAQQGLMPLVRAYRENPEEFFRLITRIRDATKNNNVILEDMATALQTVQYAYVSLRNAVEQFWKEVLLGGGNNSLATSFRVLTSGVLTLNQLMRDNSGLTGTIVQVGFAAIAAIGGLTLLRFALAGVSFMFARAGMAAVSLLNLIPGLGTLLNAGGLLGSALGFLGRLGLLGGAGYLIWRNWDQLRRWFPEITDYIIEFHRRLTFLFPQLRNLFGGFGGWLGNLEPLVTRLQEIVTRIVNILSYLFLGTPLQSEMRGGREVGPLELLGESVAGLGQDLGVAFPKLEALKQWWSEFSDSLMFREGMAAGFGAWGKAILAAFGAFSAWAVSTHGATGFLLILMALRSALFVIGTLVGAFQIIAILLSTIIAPIIESLLDRRWFRMLLGGVGLGLGGLAAMIYAFGWSGTKTLISSFWNRFVEETETGVAMFGAAWDRFMKTLFGDDSSLARLMVTGERWGRILGSWVNMGLIKLADGLNYLSATIDGFSQRHPILSSILFTAAEWWLYLAGAILVAAGALRILKGLWTLSIVGPAAVGLGGWLLGGAAAAGAAGGVSRLGRMMRMLSLGGSGIWAIMRYGPTLMGLGPLGWAITLAGVLVLIIKHLDDIKARFAELANSPVGRFLGFGTAEAADAASIGPTLETLGGSTRLKTADELWRGIRNEEFGEIRSAGQRAASALNDVANALAAAAAKIAGVAGTPTAAGVAPATEGALHDGSGSRP